MDVFMVYGIICICFIIFSVFVCCNSLDTLKHNKVIEAEIRQILGKYK